MNQIPSSNSSLVSRRDDQPPTMRAILLDWTPTRASNNLRGHAKVKLGSMTVPGIPVGVSADGQPWAKIPGKAVVRDGHQLLDGDGRLRWEPCFELATQARTAFCRAVVEAVLAEYPGALANDRRWP